MKDKIYLSPPHIGKKELKSVKKALLSGWISPAGSYINDFTTSLQSALHTNVLLTNSGSSAIHLALKGIAIQPNDIVLCSNFTFAATAFPILYEKAIPYFIGIEKQTWNIHPDFLEVAIKKCIEKQTKPKALILAYSYGIPAKYDEIHRICTQYQIPIIEDAAEALGSTYHEKALGTLGLFGVLSFNGNKIITTSAGGALLTNNENLLEDSRKRAFQSKENTLHYEHYDVGYNYAQSNILAAIGFEQFHKLEKRIQKRRRNFEFYQHYLEELALEFPIELPNSFANRWLSTFAFSSAQKKEKSITELQKNNIESRPLWNPLHSQKAFSTSLYEGDLYEMSLFERGICLPSGSSLKKVDLKRICDILLQETHD